MRPFLFSALLFISFHAQAQIPLEEVRVHDAAKLEDAEPSPAISVFDEKEIKKQNPVTVLDLLKTLPGVQVNQSGGAGQPATVFIRGASSEQTLVMMDGIEANDLLNPSGGFDFSSLSLENVERVEVYRGPQSLRYGSGAVGGVINIITKSGAGPLKTELMTEGGSYDTLRGSAVVSGQQSVVHYSVGASAFQTHGFSAADKAEGNSEADGGHRINASGRVTVDISDKSDLDFTARWFDTHADLDRSGGPGGDDPNYTSQSRQFLGGVTYGFSLLPKWRSSLGIYFTEVDRSDRNPPDATSTQDSRNSFLSERLKYAWLNSFKASSNSKLDVNFEYDENHGSGSSDYNGTITDFGRQSAWLSGGSMIYSLDTDSFFIDAGVRGDNHSAAGGVFTYSATPGYRFRDAGTVVRASVATGFKAPSLYQLYSSYGDLSLKDERTASWEISAEQALGSSWDFSGTYFNQSFSDLIDFDMIASRYKNINKAKSEGVELQTQWQIMKQAKIRLFYTWLKATDEETGLALLRRPKNSGGIELEWSPEQWRYWVRYRAVGERADVDPVSFSRIEMPFYDVTDIGAGYQLSQTLRLNGRIENLFNRHYQQIAGYGTSGLAGYVGIAGAF